MFLAQAETDLWAQRHADLKSVVAKYMALFLNFSKKNVLERVRHTDFSRIETIKDLYEILPELIRKIRNGAADISGSR